ncbi:MAG: sulfatase/phosphatase domain-containing protein, partial [Planctomycetota bacterium]
EEGRDCSELLISGKAPTDWNDIVFFRQGGKNEEAWVGAVTQQYKLVLSSDDKPWLYDLAEDADELVNYYDKPECKDVVKAMSQALIDYGQKYKDPRVLLPENMKRLKKAASPGKSA